MIFLYTFSEIVLRDARERVNLIAWVTEEPISSTSTRRATTTASAAACGGAYLCGRDKHSRKSYEHRREWIVSRMKKVSSCFAIDVCAYAIMANHFHNVLRVMRERALAWSDDEVARRYTKIFPATKPQLLLPEKQRAERIELWRHRLYDVSWFMRALNANIARKANDEDGCTGHFWEGRFKSQPLMDDAAVLTAMSYVDLNPVRAGEARSLEESTHTSIAERLGHAAAGTRSQELVPFAGQTRSKKREPLPMSFAAYRELLEWTGRACRPGARGKLKDPPTSLRDAHINADEWVAVMRGSGLRVYGWLGTSTTLQAIAKRQGKQRLWGQGKARALFAA